MEKMVNTETIKSTISVLMKSKLSIDRVADDTHIAKTELQELKNGNLNVQDTRYEVISRLYTYCLEIKGDSDESLEACIETMIETENLLESLNGQNKQYIYKGFNCEVESLQRLKAITKDKPRGTETKLMNLILKKALDRIEIDGEL